MGDNELEVAGGRRRAGSGGREATSWKQWAGGGRQNVASGRQRAVCGKQEVTDDMQWAGGSRRDVVEEDGELDEKARRGEGGRLEEVQV